MLGREAKLAINCICWSGFKLIKEGEIPNGFPTNPDQGSHVGFPELPKNRVPGLMGFGCQTFGVCCCLSESESSPESLRETYEKALSYFHRDIGIIDLGFIYGMKEWFIYGSRGDDTPQAISELDRLKTCVGMSKGVFASELL